ncbi:MAG: response regulator transcription factor [Tunicatimonas sp.]|uniref:response regulator transcription factor n=1 Tax=Tunicatimonas sp. TaxID=1940096 RepID=UPI003C73C684
MTNINPKATLLYVEDDDSLRYVTQDNLSLANYLVVACADGQSALEAFHDQPIDLCIIDVMLPKIDGFAVAKAIRQQNSQIPILFLSAKSLKEDRIAGLTLGADDYITKPFSIEELVLKVDIFLRRSQFQPAPPPANGLATIGNYRFDQGQQQLIYHNETRNLTQRESALLGYLSTHMNQVVKREDILATIWGEDDYFAGRSLDVFISRLRKYLQKDTAILIDNVHGVGFRLLINEQ